MIEELKPYDSYKSAGLRWAEHIPSHWEVDRARSCLQKLNVRSREGREELLTVSSARGVVPRKSATVTMFKAKSYAGYKLCWPDDLVINSLWAWAGGLAVSRHHGIVSSAYGVYRSRPSSKLHPRYLHELVRSAPFNWELQVRSKGIWISRLQLSDDSFLAAPVLVPSLEEQEAIVRFLDHANHRIDQFIRSKKRLIALLNEQKQAIIHRAVTRGLDPNVKFKESGVRWLGQVPVQWRVVPLKRILSTPITDGPHETPVFIDSGVDFLSAESMVNGSFHFERRRGYISREAHEEYCRKCRPRRDDVFMCKSGATTGKVALVETDSEFSVWSPLALLRANHTMVLPRFLFRALQSEYVQGQVRDRWSFGTQPNLSMGAMGRIWLALPPLAEQSLILAALEDAAAPMDEGTAIAEAQIARVREYQRRLTADVVTGQLDVREAAASLPVVEPEGALVESEGDETDIDDGEAA